jgi:hypothetical protein
LVLRRGDGNRHVRVWFSEPGGIGWGGEAGFVVGLVDPDLTVLDRIVIPEDQVAATIHDYLDRL